MRKKWLIVLLLGLLVACGGTENSDSNSGELEINNVQANLALPTDTGSVWLEIVNNTDEDEALLGAEIEGCGVIELHDMVMENDVMLMRPVEGGVIPIPAGETVELKRGGLHIMCLQKAGPLEVDSMVEIALQFEQAGEVIVEGPVVEPGGMEMDMDHGDGMDMDSEGGMEMGGDG